MFKFTTKHGTCWQINIPNTITILALGFLLGNLAFLPMIAFIGKYVQGDYRDSVNTIVSLFKDGMLLILGYYFRDKAVTRMEDKVDEQ